MKLLAKRSILLTVTFLYGFSLNNHAVSCDEPNMNDLMEFLRNGPVQYKKYLEAQKKLLVVQIEAVERQRVTEYTLAKFPAFAKTLYDAEKVTEKNHSTKTRKFKNLTLANLQSNANIPTLSDEMFAKIYEKFEKGLNVSNQTIRSARKHYNKLEEETFPSLKEALLSDRAGLEELYKAGKVLNDATAALVKVAKVGRDPGLEKEINDLNIKLEEAKKRAEQATASLVEEAKKAEAARHEETTALPKTAPVKEPKPLKKQAKPAQPGLFSTFFGTQNRIDTLKRTEITQAVTTALNLPCVLEQKEEVNAAVKMITKNKEKPESEPIDLEEIRAYFMAKLMAATKKEDFDLEERIIKLSLSEKEKILLSFAQYLKISE